MHNLTVDIGVLFFFQAEDGIRDGHVTGVQTCALPISSYSVSSAICCAVSSSREISFTSLVAARSPSAPVGVPTTKIEASMLPSRSRSSELEKSRSEERRVGKERRVGPWRAGARSKDAL